VEFQTGALRNEDPHSSGNGERVRPEGGGDMENPSYLQGTTRENSTSKKYAQGNLPAEPLKSKRREEPLLLPQNFSSLLCKSIGTANYIRGGGGP